MGRNNLTGKWGESVAAEYLRKKGYRLLACNFRCRVGEIDLIAMRKDVLVFCEVKTRKDASFAQAMEFVTAAKQQRLRLTARLWLARQELSYEQCRFDVIEVYAPDGAETKRPKIRHIEGAFT